MLFDNLKIFHRVVTIDHVDSYTRFPETPRAANSMEVRLAVDLPGLI